MNKTLGLAYVAKKLIIGTEGVIEGLRKNQIKLVILAADASIPTHKKVTDKAKTYQTPICTNYTSMELSHLLSKKNIKVIGVTDAGFAALLTK